GVVELAAPGPDHTHVRRILDGRQHDVAAAVDGGRHPSVVRRLAAGARPRRQPAPRSRQGLGGADRRCPCPVGRRRVSYREYVIAAYTVFAVVLLWDYLVPKLQVRAALRAARLRAARNAAPSTPV